EIFLLQLVQRVHQRFGHEPSAVRAEVPERVRQIFCDNGNHSGKDSLPVCGRRGQGRRAGTASLWFLTVGAPAKAGPNFEWPCGTIAGSKIGQRREGRYLPRDFYGET